MECRSKCREVGCVRQLGNCVHIRFTEGGVAVNEREIALPKMERRLLFFFLEHPDIALSRDTLLREVWDYGAPGETRTVDTHVKNLRAHLGTAGNYIRTVRGVGYLLETAPCMDKAC